MYSIGIDIGYSAIKIILMDSNCKIKYSKYLLHKGKVKQILIRTLEDVLIQYNNDDIKLGAVTGNGSKFLSKGNKAEFVNEVASIVEGSTKIDGNMGAIIKKLPLTKPILFSGGVAHNQGIITALKDVLNLEDGDLIIPEHFSHIGAYGAAIIAKNDELNINLIDLLNYVKSNEDYSNYLSRMVW